MGYDRFAKDGYDVWTGSNYKHKNGDGSKRETYINPQKQGYSRGRDQNTTDWGRTTTYEKEYDFTPKYDSEGLKVAGQMANGTGNYVNGKGWQ